MVGFLLEQLDPDRRARARAVVSDASRAVGGYVAGAFAISVAAGVVTFAMLEILGVTFSIPLAVLMAFLALIPLVGTTVGGLIIAIVTAFHDFPTALIIWGVFFLVYQQVQDRVLVPIVYQRTVELHPLLTIIAVLIGGSRLGILGALVAIPAAATVQIIVKEWWRFRQADRLPAPPAPAGPTAGEAPAGGSATA